MSISKANDDDYFANYLNEEEVEDYEATYSSNVNLIRNRAAAATASANNANANANANNVESSFEDCYIEDTTVENNSVNESNCATNQVDSSREESADPILIPPSYSKRMAEAQADDSIEDTGTQNHKYLNYDEEDSDEISDEKEEENKFTDNLAAGGSYLSMDAAGNVVRSFSFLKRVDLSHSEDEDGKSISSAPRTSLPPPSEGANGAPSLLNTSIEEEPDSSFLLPPPQADSVSSPPKKEQFNSDLAKLEASRNNQVKPPRETKKSPKKTKANNTPVLPEDERLRLLAEEEQAAAKVTSTVEAPPPQEALPADHYSNLLKAYEFVEDPSIPPLPPAKEFVMSPTDENHMDAKNHSNDISYEDDIEVGAGTNNNTDANQSIISQDEQSKKSNRVRPGVRETLLSVLSPPPASKTSRGKNDGTPETDVSRQLFNNSYDEGYEGGQSDEDCSACTGGHRGKNRGARKQRRKIWTIIVVVMTLVLAAAIGAIAYAMILQNRQAENISASSASEVVVDIAQGTNTNPQDGSIVIDINQTISDNSVSSGDFEWMDTSAPFNAPSLRPVSLKTPTGSPSAAPTSSPTRTASPTAAPTDSPTNKPTMPPTNEGDFVGRLQMLLQERNYKNPNGKPFVFDFSTSESLNEPANKALVYLAREIAAVMALPDPAETTAIKAEDGSQLGNVVVTMGDATPPPSNDPNFYPILLKDYDDDKLVQRFALLSLQFGVSSFEMTNPFAGDDKHQQDNSATTVAEPMKRIVFNDEQLSAAKNEPTEAPLDPASLADPNDVRFLVDECDWEGVVCEPIDNTTSTTTVKKIRWDYKNLDGWISPTISLLSDLVHLDLSNNALKGPIPESLYELTDLEQIILFKNEMSGTLSASIGNLDKLKRLHLSHNAFSGSLPSELKSDGGSVDGIRPIQYFNIYSNQFTGTIPQNLRWRQCVTFDVGRNNLTGTLPEDLGDKFVALRHLFLNHNSFSGTLPSNYNTVGNGRLVALALQSNQLTGVVPGDRTNYDTLVQYTLQDNQFTRLEQQNCDNYYLVEFKADCPEVCACFGRFFDFCDRWCGTSGPNNNWQQRPPRNWSF